MENDDFDVQQEPLPLKEFAVIAIASHLLKLHLPDMIQQLTEMNKPENPNASYYSGLMMMNMWTDDYCEKFSEPYLEEMKMNISKTISERLDHLLLPVVAKKKVRAKFFELSEDIYYWVMFLTDDLRLDIKYAEKIYLSSKGVIDVDHGFSIWMDKPVDVPRSGGWFQEKFNPLHYTACLLAQTEFVANHQADIINEIQSVYPWFKMDDNDDIVFRIISTVIYSYKESSNRRNPGTERDELIRSKLSAARMLDACMQCGLHKAFIYFWNHLDTVEQDNYLENLLKWSLDIKCFRAKYGVENVFQIALFLMKNMNASQKDQFILKNIYLFFFKFLRKESFQKYCVPLLHKFPSHGPCFKEKLLSRFLQNLINHVIKVGNDSQYHIQIFPFLMTKISGKKRLFLKGRSIILENIFNAFCVPALKVIFNDQELQDQTYELMNQCRIKFFSLILNENFDLLNDFVLEVVNTEARRNDFEKVLFNVLEISMQYSNTDFLDKYLAWKYGERACILKIELYPLWCSLVPRVYFNLKILFQWYLDVEEMPSISNCFLNKLALLKRFCRELVYNLWFRSKVVCTRGGDNAVAIGISEQVLSAVFRLEDEITNFKKNELAKDESCVRFLCENARNNSENSPYKFEPRFEAIDGFFNFCGLASDEMDQIKKSIADNISDWIERFGVSVERFDVVVPLLDWVYGKKDENRKMLENYFQSPDEVTSYYKNRML